MNLPAIIIVLAVLVIVGLYLWARATVNRFDDE